MAKILSEREFAEVQLYKQIEELKVVDPTDFEPTNYGYKEYMETIEVHKIHIVALTLFIAMELEKESRDELESYKDFIGSIEDQVGFSILEFEREAVKKNKLWL